MAKYSPSVCRAKERACRHEVRELAGQRNSNADVRNGFVEPLRDPWSIPSSPSCTTDKKASFSSLKRRVSSSGLQRRSSPH